MRLSTSEETDLVRALSSQLGMGSITPVLLRVAHHSIFRLAPLPIIARVQSSASPTRSLAVAQLELAVSRHLARVGVPVVPSLDPTLAGPHLQGRCVITLWPHVDHDPARAAGRDREAALALQVFHRGLASFSGQLPKFLNAVDECRATLVDSFELPRLSSEHRRFLEMCFDETKRRLHALTYTSVPVHGDPHRDNILWTADGPLWGDLEAVCAGPIEWDLSALSASQRALFPEASPHLIRLLADLRSACVAVWCLAESSRSVEIDAAAEYHLDRLRRIVPRSGRP